MEPGTQTGPRWRLYLAIAVVVLAAVFILQNSEETEIKFFFSTVTTPLIFGLLLAFALGLVVGLVLPRFRRHD